MTKCSFARSGLILVLLGGMALPVLVADEAAAPTSRERRLQLILGRLDMLEHEYRRQRAMPAAAVPSAALDGPIAEIGRLRGQLDSWLARADREPYRRNLDRFLRDLERRLGRLEIGLREPGFVTGESARRPAGVKPVREPAMPESAALRADVPANDDCAGAIPVGDGSVSGDSTAATVDGESGCGASIAGPDVWYRYTAAEAGEVVFDTLGSAFDTVLSLHSGCPGTPANELECNDDEVGVQSELSRVMGAGEEVFVRVGGYAGDYGSYLLSIGRTSELTGVVTDAATGQGISSAHITVYDQSGGFAGSASTGLSGAYIVTGLSSGVYYATAYHHSYETQLYDGIPCPSYCYPTTGTPIVLGAGSTAIADFALHPGSAIAGRVTSEDTGAGLSSIRVQVYDSHGSYRGGDYSDYFGNYEISDLGPGTYFAHARSGSGHLGELFDDIPCPDDCVPTGGTPIVVGVDETATVDFSLPLGGSVAGRVTAGLTGVPLSDGYVSVYDSAGDWVDSESTNSMGEFTLGGLSGGSYFAVASADGYLEQLYDSLDCEVGCDPTGGTPIAVSIGVETAGVDFALVRESAFSGLVTDAAVGVPVEGVGVEAWDGSGEWQGNGPSGRWGNFVVGGLRAGSYFAKTENNVGYLEKLYDDLPCPESACDPATGTPIVVSTAMNTTGIDFALDLGGSISGTVSDAAQGGPVSGRVRIWDGGGVLVDDPYLRDGRYRLDGLTAGSYFVSTDASPFSSWIDELYDDIPCEPSCTPTSGTPVAVSLGVESSGIDFALCGGPGVQARFPPSHDPDSFIDGCRLQVDGEAWPYDASCPGVSRVYWQWGDGKDNDSPFPATHMYEPGNEWVTVAVKAFDALGTESFRVAKNVHLWNCLAPGVCGEPETRELYNLALDSTELLQACTVVVAGPGFRVLDPGDVTIRAGASVKLGSGVQIEGGQLRIEIDPALLP